MHYNWGLGDNNIGTSFKKFYRELKNSKQTQYLVFKIFLLTSEINRSFQILNFS